MYQALYRKWRPRTFDDVVGQGHITETLKNQVSTGRLSHAYLFIGTRGTGKTTCAKILAKAVNCEEPVNGNPCNRCRTCRGIDDGSIMDVVEMDAASNNGVDSVRALRDEAIFSPASAKKRVYIIDEVHMLSASAFNALLKILEEPPEHLMFILATTELHKVLPTILSRCQRHSFKRLDTGSIVSRLLYVAGQEKIDLRPDAAQLIAGLAEGGMRDALSMLDQCSGRERIDADTVYSAMGLAGTRDICAMLRHIADGNTAAAIDLFQTLWQNGKDPATLLGELSSLLREILMKTVAPKGSAALLSGCYDEASLASFAGVFSTGHLVNNISIIQSALADMRSGQARTICELCLINLCEPALGDDLPLLRERVAKLEALLKNGLPAAAPAPRPVPIPEPIAEPAPVPAKQAEPEPDFSIFSAPEEQPEPEYVPEPDPEPEEEYVPDFFPPAEDYGYIPEERPLPEEPPMDPRAALLSAAARAPERAVPPEEVPFDLDVPSFMREPETEKPKAPPEIKRKIYFGSAPQEQAEPDLSIFRDEPSPAPVPTPAAPEAEPGGDIWEKTKALLQDRIPPGLYLLLADSMQVEGYMDSGELVIAVKSGFAMNMLNRPDGLAKISLAATQAAGRNTPVRIVEADKAAPAAKPAAPKTDKLDELGRFQIVTFK